MSQDLQLQLAAQSKSSGRVVRISANGKNLPFNVIKLVQDASLGDHNNNAAISMLNDYESIIDDKTLFICCINRGILQDVISRAKDNMQKQWTFFTEVARHIDTSREIITNTWPVDINVFDKMTKVAIWPMEVSSLFDNLKHSAELPSPFQQVNLIATKIEGWEELKISLSKKGLNHEFCPLLLNHQA